MFNIPSKKKGILIAENEDQYTELLMKDTETETDSENLQHDEG